MIQIKDEGLSRGQIVDEIFKTPGISLEMVGNVLAIIEARISTGGTFTLKEALTLWSTVSLTRDTLDDA
jgi:hypothetical protein